MNAVRQVKAIITEIYTFTKMNERAPDDPTLAGRLVDAVWAMDRALTGKTENRNRERDLERATLLLQVFAHWDIYLSDGGYSRVWLDPLPLGDCPMWITRGDPMTCGSRHEVVEKYDRLMAEED